VKNCGGGSKLFLKMRTGTEMLQSSGGRLQDSQDLLEIRLSFVLKNIWTRTIGTQGFIRWSKPMNVPSKPMNIRYIRQNRFKPVCRYRQI
jgi:hypothetical protein